MKIERRFLQAEQLRSLGEGKMRVGGYAAVFEKLSQDLGGFREKIQRGAFANSVASGDVRALWNHDSSIVLGRTTSKTLRISEDEYGLNFEVDLPDTQAGRDARVSIERGDVDGVSFGFEVLEDKVDRSGDEIIRTLLSVNLFEVSPCTFPAYLSSNVEARSLGEVRDSLMNSLAKRATEEGVPSENIRNAFEARCIQRRILRRISRA